ncbi:MAG TPA: OsmC family protein [Candidatus Nitrosotalea sp.]|nr:OsmC family protein [Candidatus Nitrosotalea sp.]
MSKTLVRWAGTKTRFVVESGSGHSAEIDEPPLLGDDSGMRPTEMLLSALGGCSGVNAVLLLKKHRQRFSALAVAVSGEQAEAWPRAFTSIEIEFQITWEDGFQPDPELVEKALQMACEVYCPVHATLSAGTSLSHRLQKG